MSTIIKRDLKKRLNSANFETKRLLVKAISKNLLLPKIFKLHFIFLLAKLPKFMSFTQCRNFCNLTFKSKGVFFFFGVERFILREKIINGRLNYITYNILS